jgi:hypothetical protein
MIGNDPSWPSFGFSASGAALALAAVFFFGFRFVAASVLDVGFGG